MGNSMQTDNFGRQDKMISCPCCGKGELSAGMHILLEIIRAHLNAPVTITSGSRCKAHHLAIYKKLGKDAPEYSDHLLDDVFQSSGGDIKVKGHTPMEVYNFLNNTPYAGILALGVYSTWLHVGLRGYPARWGV